MSTAQISTADRLFVPFQASSFRQETIDKSDWENFFRALRSLDESSESIDLSNLKELLQNLLQQEPDRECKELLKEELAKLKPGSLDLFLMAAWLVSAERGGEGAPKWVSDCLDLEAVKAIIQDKYEGLQDVADYLADCKLKLVESEVEFKDQSWEITKIWKAFVSFLTNIIDIFLIAFTLFDVGKDPQSAWEAQAMLDIYYKFFMIPAVISVLIKLFLPAAGLEVYAITAGVVAVLMVLMTIYIRFLRPCPDTLPHCESNLTLDALQGRIGQVIGREAEIDEMIHMLDNKECKQKNHVLLVGKSGVGKTEIVKGVARRIARGDVPDSLKGRKVFLVNTASLVSGGFFGYADQMKVLLNRIRRLDQVILFFDEVHVALKNKSSLSDFLKPLLDRPDLMCVAATTDHEFKEHIAGGGAEAEADKPKGDPAFLRRFNLMEIKSIEREALLQILLKRQQASSSHVFAETEVLEYLLTKIEEDEDFKKKGQPAFALSVLDLCISSVAKVFEESWKTKKLSDLHAEVEAVRLHATESIQSVKPKRKGQGREIRDASREESENRRIGEMLKNYKKVAATRRALFSSLHETISAVEQGPSSHKEREGLGLFLDMEYHLPTLEKVMDDMDGAIGNLSESEGERVFVKVTQAVVDQTLAKMKIGMQIDQ
ncbi:AAA family ATPase [Estrella lausannensis]|uniref:Chaperone protein ClpB n=1 Tax=Estrella lausannensis TaxID=483423 RepID=A0A0H5DQI6_9BACT|nr:AAA family ATPase [Estrella lausannensis]CRX38343.1 Chaperone protein ClpB [Estrella lausannensis]